MMPMAYETFNPALIYARLLDDGSTAMVVNFHGTLYGGVALMANITVDVGYHRLSGRISTTMSHRWVWFREIGDWEDFVRQASERQWTEPAQIEFKPALTKG